MAVVDVWFDLRMRMCSLSSSGTRTEESSWFGFIVRAQAFPVTRLQARNGCAETGDLRRAHSLITAVITYSCHRRLLPVHGLTFLPSNLSPCGLCVYMYAPAAPVVVTAA